MATTTYNPEATVTLGAVLDGIGRYTLARQERQQRDHLYVGFDGGELVECIIAASCDAARDATRARLVESDGDVVAIFEETGARY